MYLLHLPCKQQSSHISSGSNLWLNVFKSKTLKRIIRPASDLFDSEASSDEDMDTNGDVVNENQSNDSSQNKANSSIDDGELKKKKQQLENDPAGPAIVDTLTALSNMYDNFSFTDSYLSLESELCEGSTKDKLLTWQSGRLMSGLSDDKHLHDGKEWCYDLCNDIRTQIHVRSLCQVNAELDAVTGRIPQSLMNQSDIKDRFTLPVPRERLKCVSMQDCTAPNPM